MKNKQDSDYPCFAVGDYNNPSEPIYIGWRGSGHTVDSAEYLAAYGRYESGLSYIKDLSFDNLKTILGTMPPSAHTHSYLPLSGGTLSNDIKVSHSGEANIIATHTGSNEISIALEAAVSGRSGIWCFTDSKWIIYREVDGTPCTQNGIIPGASVSGSTLYITV